MSEEDEIKLILKWNEESGKFLPVESEDEMKDGIFLELLNKEKKWKYFYIKGASLISRRTSLRVANGISKTGYVHPNSGIRYGIEFSLLEEQSPYDDMPDKLKLAQRAWYEKKKS